MTRDGEQVEGAAVAEAAHGSHSLPKRELVDERWIM